MNIVNFDTNLILVAANLTSMLLFRIHKVFSEQPYHNVCKNFIVDFSFFSSMLIILKYSTAILIEAVGSTLYFVSFWFLGGFVAATSSVSVPSAAFPTLKLENVCHGVL